MRNIALTCVGLLVLATLTTQHASAQRRSAAGKVEKKTLLTKDGVSVGVTYYPSTLGTNATPVVMLHDFKESRAVYDGFATRLQQPEPGDKHRPFAVLTVDLRGHGDSVSQTFPRPDPAA